uniref:TFIIS-type domain-containing protein n=1 Tax=viral metagenome TaxID=1070528 RepID=A0A6C0EB08_9ZZZZ
MQKLDDFTIDTFSYEKEYKKKFNFMTSASSDIKVDFIKYAETNLDRKSAVLKLDKYCKRIDFSYELENGIFEFTLVHATNNEINKELIPLIYNDKLNDICDNLDPDNKRINNKTLLESLHEKKLKPSVIAFLPPEQLHPMRWKDILDKNNLRETTLKNVNTTDIYKCRKCGERKFKITTMQMRCADEPETKILTCLVCYNVFTKN